MEILFIGGCADGKRLDIDERAQSFRVEHDAEPMLLASADLPSYQAIEVDNYRRVALHSGVQGSRYEVMLHDREPCVIAALLRGYRGS